MKQDLRTLMQQEQEQKFKMPKNHEKRFLDKIEHAFPTQKQKPSWLKWSIAANIALILGVGSIYFYSLKSNEITTANSPSEIVDAATVGVKKISLGDLSPELARIEDYYTQHIQMELVSLEGSEVYKDLVKNSMDRLAELDNEYDLLTEELNQFGPNQKLISALIQNLQWKLDLIRTLNDKLIKLKTSSKNEQALHQL